MINTIPVLWPDLNRHFFDDIFLKSSDNGNPRKIFVWINDKLLYYSLSWGNDNFNHNVAIINNVCDIILLLLFK